MSAIELPHNSPLMFEEIEPGLGLVTMNRPERLNALNIAMVESFEALSRDLAGNDDIRVLILIGSGRGFCAGADLVEVAARSGDEEFASGDKFLRLVQQRFSNLVLAFRQIPQPVIAAVNGPSAGGGFALALASDIRIAAPEAYFLASFINIGLSGGEMGTSYLLPRLIGLSRASEILYSGRRVGAAEAERIGLVTKIVPLEDLRAEAIAVARTMMDKSPSGLMLTKRVLNDNAAACSLAAAMELENRNQTIMVFSNEFFKRVNAFVK